MGSFDFSWAGSVRRFDFLLRFELGFFVVTGRVRGLFLLGLRFIYKLVFGKI